MSPNWARPFSGRAQRVERASGWEEWRGGSGGLGGAGEAQLGRPPDVSMMQATDFADWAQPRRAQVARPASGPVHPW